MADELGPMLTKTMTRLDRLQAENAELRRQLEQERVAIDAWMAKTRELQRRISALKQPAPDAAALLSFGTHWTGQYAAARCPQCGAESSRWPWVEGRMAGDFESALSAHGLLAWAARHQRECAARAAGTEAGR